MRQKTAVEIKGLEQEAFRMWENGMKLAEYATVMRLIGYIKVAPDERVEGLIICVRDKLDFMLAQMDRPIGINFDPQPYELDEL